MNPANFELLGIFCIWAYRGLIGPAWRPQLARNPAPPPAAPPAGGAAGPPLIALPGGDGIGRP